MTTTVDTNGWHTVAAITYADVNKAIATTGVGPKTFTQTAPDGSAAVTGSFGPWRLATGGSGPLLMMSLPVTGGEVTVESVKHPISACTALVQITATYIPQSGTSLMHLVNDSSQPVSVESCLPKQSNFVVEASLRGLLETWLNANLDQFNAVFASVDLDADYVHEGLKWLTPSFKGYAVAEPTQNATLTNSVFGVLCLIDGTNEPPGLVWQISPFVIPAGANAGFVISEEKFLEHMMLAAVPAMFQGIKDDPADQHFVIDNGGTRIRNKGTVQLLPVKLKKGKTVEPTVSDGNFTIQLDQAELELGITDMQFEYSPGITVHLNYTGRTTISLDTEHEILQMSAVIQSGSGSVEISKGLEIAEIVLGVASIVLAVVGGLGGAVGRSASAAVETATTGTLGAAEAVGEDAAQAANATVSACRGLINGTPAEVSEIAARCFAVAKVAAIGAFATTLMPAIAQIINAVAEGDYQSMPKITDLTSSAVGKTVIWPEQVGTFNLQSAGLNGAFQFGLVHAS
jgi:hypothetical protein